MRREKRYSFDRATAAWSFVHLAQRLPGVVDLSVEGGQYDGPTTVVVTYVKDEAACKLDNLAEEG